MRPFSDDLLDRKVSDRHGIDDWDCTLEPSKCLSGLALRLGLRMVGSLRQDHAEALVAERENRGPYQAVAELSSRVGLPKAAVTLLANAGAFGSVGLSRRPAAREALGKGGAAPLYYREPAAPVPKLPAMAPDEEVAADYRVGLSLKGHPMTFVRQILERRGVKACGGLARVRDGAFATVAGLVLLRQRPGSAKGVTSMTLEDETGQANLVVYPDVWARFRTEARRSSALLVAGRVQRDTAGTTHFVAARLEDLSAAVGTDVKARDFH